MTEGKEVEVGTNCYVDDDVRFYGDIVIGDNVYIEGGVSIGAPTEEEISSFMASRKPSKTIHEFTRARVTIGNNCRIRNGTVISSGVSLGNGVDCFNHVLIGAGTRIGDNVRIGHSSQIHKNVVIGRNVRFKGFAANDCAIGNDVAMLGYLVHKFQENVRGLVQPSPTIMDRAVVGMLAIVIGGVTIHEDAYVAAGSVVLSDVDQRLLVAGVPAKVIRRLGGRE